MKATRILEPVFASRPSPGRAVAGRRAVRLVCALALSVAAARMAHALEGGASGYPMGAENYDVGVVPNPGTYFLNYSLFYSAGRFNGNAGQPLYPFSQTLAVEAPRVVHAFDATVFGGTPFVALLAAAGSARLSIDSGASGGHGTSLFEAIETQGIGWHLSPHLHALVTVDEFIPLDSYQPLRTLNLSTNRFVTEPVLAVTYSDPDTVNVSVKLMYDLASRNPATGYLSGQDFHVDYAAGLNLAKWIVGVGGYYEHQVTDDRQYGRVVSPNGFKAQALAIGPDIQYAVDDVSLRLKWQKEVYSRNKTQGEALWFTATVPIKF